MIYWGKNHRLAFAMLEYGIMNNAGFTVITGEIGCGKTTLLRYLLRNLDSQITVGLITSTPQGKAELLQWVMMSLNQPFEDPTRRCSSDSSNFCTANTRSDSGPSWLSMRLKTWGWTRWKNCGCFPI